MSGSTGNEFWDANSINKELEKKEKDALLEKLRELQDEMANQKPFGDEENNRKLLIDLDCIYDCDRDEYRLVVKAGIVIGKREVFLKEKKKLSKDMIKRLEKLRAHLNERLKNKKSLIDLLK